jgi:hypothetical protein
MQPQSPNDRNQQNYPPQSPQVPPNYPGLSPQPPSATHPAYDFIMNPSANTATGPSFKLPGMSGLNPQLRLAIIVLTGAVVLLVILSAVFKSINAPGNVTQLTSVIQDQQELIHLAGEASQEPNITQSDQNLTATATPTLTSSQTALKTYLADIGGKLNVKFLDVKESTTTDQELTDSVSTGTYDATFDGIFKNELNSYLNDLNTAYKVTTGSRGKAILSGDYKQGKLLITEISSQT